MPVFHFDLVDGITIKDAGGHPCADFEEAKLVATGLAVRLAKTEPHLIGKGFAIAVKTQDDEEVFRADLDLINKLSISN